MEWNFAFTRTFVIYTSGLAIQWGPIGDVGMYQSLIGADGMVLPESTRYVPQRILSCLHSLDQLLNQSEPVVCSYIKADIPGSGSNSSREDLVQCICNILGIYMLDKTSDRPLESHVYVCSQKKTYVMTDVTMSIIKVQKIRYNVFVH